MSAITAVAAAALLLHLGFVLDELQHFFFLLFSAVSYQLYNQFLNEFLSFGSSYVQLHDFER